MRFKQDLYSVKHVDYFGQTIMVPSWTRYLATNEDGTLLAYDEENYPWECQNGWGSDGKCEVVARFHLMEGDWRTTLLLVD